MNTDSKTTPNHTFERTRGERGWCKRARGSSRQNKKPIFQDPTLAYKREDLGKGTRGKHYAAYSNGTNLVLISPDVEVVFPTAEAVNDALRGLVHVAKKTSRLARTSKRRAA